MPKVQENAFDVMTRKSRRASWGANTDLSFILSGTPKYLVTLGNTSHLIADYMEKYGVWSSALIISAPMVVFHNIFSMKNPRNICSYPDEPPPVNTFIH